MTFEKTVLYTLFLTTLLTAQNFSVRNLNSIPTYEKYLLKASVNDVEETSIEIEYRVVHKGTDSAYWHVKGQMPLNGIEIKEEYKIGLKDLNVFESTRTQTYKRGKTVQNNSYRVDTKTSEEGIFLVSSFNSLMYIIRSFPFDQNVSEIRVRLAQQTRKNFAVRVRNKGLKTVKNPIEGEIEAYEADVSLAVPVIGAFLPNIRYYFKNDDAHTLVAMKGAFGASGKKIQIHLVKHEIEE